MWTKVVNIINRERTFRCTVALHCCYGRQYRRRPHTTRRRHRPQDKYGDGWSFPACLWIFNK